MREDEWLISAILREINQLEGVEKPAFTSHGVFVEEAAFISDGFFGGRAGLQAGVKAGKQKGFSP